MPYSEMDTDILLLVANGLEHAAKERLREMTPDEWRTWRDACSLLDEWLDDLVIERHTQASQRRTNL